MAEPVVEIDICMPGLHRQSLKNVRGGKVVIQILALGSTIELLDSFAFANTVCVGVARVATDIVKITPDSGEDI
jgi:hypothetical protein